MTKIRADLLLVDRGLFESRSKAAAAIMAGDVSVGGSGERLHKAGQMVDTSVKITVERDCGFVSRGGIKLQNALRDLSGLRVTGTNCLDAGASTGGFTDCLLQNGAARVIAVDVAYGEFDWRLRNDSRVTLIERTNVRELNSEDLPYRPDLVVADLSFISLTKVLAPLVACASAEFDMLALVKPQFEVGQSRIGKGGVVRDPRARRDAIIAVVQAGDELGLTVNGVASSGLPGPAGNRESFVWFSRGSKARPIDVSTAVAAVEPVR